MKRTTIILCVTFFILLAYKSYSQYYGFDCEIAGEDRFLWPTDGTILKYIPDEYTTTKYIKVNFHFMLKSDSTLCFRPYDDGLGNTSFTAYDYSNTIVNNVNLGLTYNEQMHLPQGNSTPCLDRRYRIVLQNIYFHYDDNAYSCYSQSPGYMDYSELNYYSINPSTEINVFFLYNDNIDNNGNYISGGEAPLSGNRWVRMKASWQQYRDYGSQVFWATSCTLLHEIGHNLGLHHTMLDGGGYCCNICDDNLTDTPTIPEILALGYPNPCPGWGDTGPNYSNNAMDYSGLLAMTPQQLGVIHYTLTHDMFTYLEDNYCYINTNVQDCYITNNTDLTWQNNRIMMSNLIIESGSKLTLKNCWLHMPSDARIIVKPGGALILDGAVITNKCNYFWQGIEVWGNSSAHQYMVNNNYLQGYLEMKNGATIENAKCAVQLWKPNYISTTGGIIHATDAVFRNNATSLIALNYNNYNPNTGHDMDYNSYFTDCEFVVDGNYLGNETFYTHVELGYNRGIDFTGCDFSVSSSANGVSANNAGITAYSAGFGVKSSCMDPNTYPCPTNSIKGCTFTGFNTGILSINEGNNTNTLSVKDAVFTNNHTGIHALNIGYAAIVGNEFNIGCGTDCTYGVYIDGATSFCIEENLFKPATFIKCTRYGVGVFNSPSINDIYLNTFNNLTYGNLSYGVNYNVNGGLTYSCNENSGNKIDFCVLKDNGFGMPKPIQGSSTSPAGNTFGGSQYHIYNDGDLLMDYHYNSSATGQTPNSSKLYRVNAYPTTYSNSCASHYGGGGVLKSPEEKAALAEIYKTSQDNHERYLAAGDIIRSNLNDSVANPTELRQWLANMNEIASDRMIVASYIHEGDFTNAFALANTLPNKYNLQGDELSDHNDYMTLLNLYRALYNSNRTVRELTESEKETVANIAENGHGASKLMATGIIMETSDRTAVSYICPALSREDGDKNEDTSGNKDIDYVDELFVGLSPIPASTWVSVDYKLPANYAKATMTIMSSYGAKIMDVELLGDKGTTTIDLRDLSNGVYSYIVRCGDKIFTGKLVVTK